MPCSSGCLVQSEKMCLITVLQWDVVICKASASIVFPMNDLRCKQWEVAVQRDGWCLTQYSRICEAHFAKGMCLHIP